ncbi:hypothetical protein [Chitinolyticbacter albus]|uniref:hypothetical protein n=1 Tax=Chitinolyticbacter albus TaxID=2961951 RepID=UPI002109C5AE|nr:hypothetical protein [Chitinolyticbacter albus]
MSNVIDQEIHRLAVASIRRSSMDINTWLHTTIAGLHPGIPPMFELDPGELPLTSGFFSEQSWWVITTRRIACQHAGAAASLDPRFGIEFNFDNFKGLDQSRQMGALPCSIATITSLEGKALHFEFETGKASMAPIYACRFWRQVARFHHNP